MLICTENITRQMYKKKNGPSKVGRQVAGYHDRGRPAFHCPPFKNLSVMYHIYIYIYSLFKNK